MDDSSNDLDQLALALVHWLDAHTHAADPVAGARALEEVRRHLNPYMPGSAPVTRPRRRPRWLAFW